MPVSFEAAISRFREECLSISKLTFARKRHFLGTLADLRAVLAAEYSISDPTKVASYHLKRYARSLNFDDARRKRRVLLEIRSFFSFLERAGACDFDPAEDLLPRKTPSRPIQPPDLAPSTTTVSETTTTAQVATLTAHAIKERLDTKVVGQDSAKRQLAVLLSMHMSWFGRQDRLHRSPNALLIGPTGVGKTHTIRVASEYLGIPFVAVDTTSLVESGIVGYQIEEVLQDLARAAAQIVKRRSNTPKPDEDIELARRGIIFLDEFDKIAVREEARDAGRMDGFAVQRRLLKLAEGAVLGVGVRQRQFDERAARSIDTSGILLLAGGAFFNIDEPRVRAKRSAELQRELSKGNPNVVVSADVVSYGIMPELVARLPIIVEFTPLDESHLMGILDNPEISPIRVWTDHFETLGLSLSVSTDAKEYVARRALSLKMGARGLDQVLYPLMHNLAYEAEISRETDDRVLEITREQIEKLSTTNGRKSNAGR